VDCVGADLARAIRRGVERRVLACAAGSDGSCRCGWLCAASPLCPAGWAKIAYQVCGGRRCDLVFVPGLVSDLELAG
jgi:2-keto-3-deoxy-galactonokinase